MACLDIHHTVSVATIDSVASLPGGINIKRDIAVMATGGAGFEIAGIVFARFSILIEGVRYFVGVSDNYREIYGPGRMLDRFRRVLEIEETVFNNTVHLLISRAGGRHKSTKSTKSGWPEITEGVLACLPKQTRTDFSRGCIELGQTLETLEQKFRKYPQGLVGVDSILAMLCH